MITQFDQSVKLILIGGSGVGKSSLLMQFAQNKFTQNYLTTIGVDFRFKMIKQQGITIKFQIWDTAGQQRFRTITSSYYKGTQGILMVYDLTDSASIDDLQNFWIPQAYNYCDKSTPVLLLGNKCDCPKTVNADRIKKLAQKYGYKTQEVSAKTGDKVQQSIKSFGVGIVRSRMEKGGMSWGKSGGSGSPTLTKEDSKKSQKSQKKDKDEGSKQMAASTATVSLKAGGSKGNVPGYKKKCC